MYEVIKDFRDIYDNHEYKVGDVFPEKGKTAERLAQLCGSDNLQGVPLIKKKKTENRRGYFNKKDDLL